MYIHVGSLVQVLQLPIVALLLANVYLRDLVHVLAWLYVLRQPLRQGLVALAVGRVGVHAGEGRREVLVHFGLLYFDSLRTFRMYINVGSLRHEVLRILVVVELNDLVAVVCVVVKGRLALSGSV